jgi:alkanesulfonate monooxygenase SsuD/methylene tetrahydromethanopterin reductase-like flavin-dependent oxidoreductase (luciferase family)
MPIRLGFALPVQKTFAIGREALAVCAAVWGPDPVSYTGPLSTIAPSEVGPKPTRPIPVLLAGATLASFRRIADHADGWIPVATDPAHLAGQWKRLQALAAERDRRRPIRLSIATTVTITRSRADEQDRPPFVGNLEQVTSDAIRFTQAVPTTDLLMSLSGSLTSAGQLIDTADTLHAALRAAGV